MTRTNDKLRALFLASLMVFSVFAMTATVSADHTRTAANEVLDVENYEDADRNLSSQTRFWQGQDLYFQSNTTAAGTTWEIHTVEEDDSGLRTLGDFVRQISLGENSTRLIDSSTLSAGEYVILNTNDNAVVFSGTFGNVSYFRGGTAQADLDRARWSITVQTIDSLEWDEDTVDTEDTEELEITSNRGSYDVEIYADGLDEDDLIDLFSDDADTTVDTSDDDVADDDGIILTGVTDDSAISANFSNTSIDPGDYTFEVEVHDTDASATADVTVQEEDVTIEFAEGSYTTATGDPVEVTLNLEDTDEAFLFVGGEDVNYLERIHLEDDDEDGQVTLVLNTFRMGRNGTDAAGNSFTNGFAQNNSSIDGEDEAFDPGDDTNILGVTRYNSTGTNLDIEVGLDDPLEEASYDLIAASSGDITLTGANAGNVQDEEDLASLNLVERSTNGIRTMVAPRGDAEDLDEEDLNELLADATGSSQVTIPGDDATRSDRLIIQVNVTGVFGYIEDENLNSLVGAGNAGVNGLNLTVEQTNEAGNADPKVLDLAVGAGTSAELYTDPANSTFYVVVEMANIRTETRRALDDGDQWSVEFQVGVADDGEGINYNGADDVEENPYVGDDEEELVTTSLTTNDVEADFDNVVDEEVLVGQEVDTLSGTINVAPGSEVTVRARKTGSGAFFETVETDVTSQGTFSAEFDFSNRPVDTEFEVSLRYGGSTVVEEDARVVGAATASVTFNDQTSNGEVVSISSVTMSRGGFVGIHDGSASGPVIGSSKFLSAGTHQNVRVALDEPLDEDGTLVAMPHRDTNNNQVFDFPSADGPYTADGAAVTDSASISVAVGTPTPRVVTVEQPSPTPRVEERTVIQEVERTVIQEVERTVIVTQSPGQPGFGIAVAVVALLAAAMLALRRRD